MIFWRKSEVKFGFSTSKSYGAPILSVLISKWEAVMMFNHRKVNWNHTFNATGRGDGEKMVDSTLG